MEKSHFTGYIVEFKLLHARYQSISRLHKDVHLDLIYHSSFLLSCYHKHIQIHVRKQETCLVKSKEKVTLVQALKLCTGRTAHRGIEV